MKSGLTIVLKVGSASLVDAYTYAPNASAFDSIAETIRLLRLVGHHVVLVTSGAVALGRGMLGMQKEQTSRAMAKAVAAVGQTKLMTLWEDALARTQQQGAQVLLLKDSPSTYRMLSTLRSLLDLGIIPIVNENDAIATKSFGGNDIVGVLVAKTIKADVLAFLTDVDCLYTRNPRTYPDAEAIETVENCESMNIDVSSTGTALGTGGMEIKLLAAKAASSRGITTIINNVSNATNIVDIVHNLYLNKHQAAAKRCSVSCCCHDMMSFRRRATGLHTLFLPASPRVK